MRRRRLPARAVRGARLQLAIHGQKTFNGVALLSKLPFDEVEQRLAGRRRATITPASSKAWSRPRSGVLRVASIYLPNGNPPETEKYSYKIGWMKRLLAYARERLKLEEPLILAGDYNVIPSRRRRRAIRRPGSATRCSCRARARVSSR